MSTNAARVLETKKNLTALRVEAQNVKNSSPKLGEKTMAVHPEDITLMFAAEMCNEHLKQGIRINNKIKAYQRMYGMNHPVVVDDLLPFAAEFFESKELATKRLQTIVKKHRLTKRLRLIKGLGDYTIGLIMGHMKSIYVIDDETGEKRPKFATPAALAVYAGVGVKYGLKVSKTNLNRIRERQYEELGNKDFGFNTDFAGRMYAASDNLLKATNGWFKHHYDQLRLRLTERCINNDETFVATAEDQKASKGKMQEGRRYIKGRKNQSIEAFTHSNAKTRIARILLHLIYTEWMTLEGLEPRIPYPIEYLGHNKLITLDEVIEFDTRKKN